MWLKILESWALFSFCHFGVSLIGFPLDSYALSHEDLQRKQSPVPFRRLRSDVPHFDSLAVAATSSFLSIEVSFHFRSARFPSLITSAYFLQGVFDPDAALFNSEERSPALGVEQRVRVLVEISHLNILPSGK